MRQPESGEPHDRHGRRRQAAQSRPVRWADGRTRPRPAAEAPAARPASVSVSASIPIASSTGPVSAVFCCWPSSAATTARATACPIQKPPPASPRSQPLPPATLSSLPARIRAATVPVPAIRAYPSRAAVPEWKTPSRSCSRTTIANTQCSEPARDLRTKGGSLLAGHRNQGQGRSVGAGRTRQSLLRRDANGSRSLAGCRLPSDSHRWRNRSRTRAQQRRRRPRGCWCHRRRGQAISAATSEGFQFGFIGCREES